MAKFIIIGAAVFVIWIMIKKSQLNQANT